MQQLGRARIFPLIAIILLVAAMGYILFSPRTPPHTIMIEGAFGAVKPGQPGQIALYLHLVNFGAENDALVAVNAEGSSVLYCSEVGACGPMPEILLPATEHTIIDQSGAHISVTVPPETKVLTAMLVFRTAPSRQVKIPVRGNLQP
jgi:hypothetical protein